MSSTITFNCFNCGKEIKFADRVGFRDECEFCHADARCCKNCRFYDPKAYNECHEPSAEVVMEKNRSNRCEFFQPRGPGGGVGAKSTAAEDLIKAAEALFKKS